ncbi:MAG: ABC transporter permease [Christensenella sp.]|nr:ABC transporter permease [Christensenella sp.]
MMKPLIKKNSKVGGILKLLGILAIVYAVCALIQPARFANTNTLYIMFQQAFIPSVLASGLYFIVVMGMFDFAIGSIMVLAGIMGGLAAQTTGYIGMFAVCICVGIALELLNGFLYIKLKVPSLIVSIGLMMIFETIGTFFNNSRGVVLGENSRMFGKAPYNIIVGCIALVLAYILYTYTKRGVQIRAIGTNELVAQSAGIKVNQTKIFAYMFCGLFVGIASILSVSYGGSFQPVLNMQTMDRNFMPLLGCFIGLAFRKTVNPIISIFCGEFLIMMITTGVMTMGGDATIQDVVTGVVLLIIVALTMRQNKDLHVIVK